LLVLYGLDSFFGAIFLCVPIEAGWSMTPGTGRCMDRAVLYYLTSGFNVAADIVIFALPVPLITNLPIHRNQKIALLFVFTFGAL
jgi:hypothetical protein